MTTREDSERRLAAEVATLRRRLEDAEEMCRAIQLGQVDGFVVAPNTENAEVRLLSAEWERYREILERVRDGAVTVSASGEILYANQQFVEMVGEELASLFNNPLERYVPRSDHAGLLGFLGCG